jgi:putative mRNA 3-end processing factor
VFSVISVVNSLAHELIRPNDSGLYCEQGGFHVDPWKPVERAVITHAHSDHARAGSRSYLCAKPGESILRLRLGSDANIQPIAFGEPVTINGVRVSLHPAGHLLGSAQVRIEYEGRVTVISGDYKTEPDPTCEAFEPIACDTFITESTFGLPIYRWAPAQETFNDINQWWRDNRAAGVTSIVYAYALGKAQRLIAGVDASIGPILAHGAILRLVEAYRDAGVQLPAVLPATPENVKAHRGEGGALVIAPTSAQNNPWLRKFGEQSSAFASGWMQVRGNRRRRNVDRGFVLSDHADWHGLLDTIRATGAKRIGVTHGYADTFARYLRELGYDAFHIRTRFSDMGEEGESTTEITENTEKEKEKEPQMNTDGHGWDV